MGDEQRPQLRLSQWKGFDNYGCPYCDYDDLNEGRALDHVYGRHAGKTPAAPVHAHLFDAAGNPIQTEDISQ